MLHTLQEADNIDFALEEDMAPDLGDTNQGYVHDNLSAGSPTAIAWNTSSQQAEEEPEVNKIYMYNFFSFFL